MAIDLKFEFQEVLEKEKRRYKKGSKYDPIIDAYLDSAKYKAKAGDGLQKLEVGKDTDPNYLSLQIKKRVKAREIPITITVSNGVIYFEKAIK